MPPRLRRGALGWAQLAGLEKGLARSSLAAAIVARLRYGGGRVGSLDGIGPPVGIVSSEGAKPMPLTDGNAVPRRLTRGFESCPTAAVCSWGPADRRTAVAPRLSLGRQAEAPRARPYPTVSLARARPTFRAIANEYLAKLKREARAEADPRPPCGARGIPVGQRRWAWPGAASPTASADKASPWENDCSGSRIATSEPARSRSCRAPRPGHVPGVGGRARGPAGQGRPDQVPASHRDLRPPSGVSYPGRARA
jgi:hypothetical protein